MEIEDKPSPHPSGHENHGGRHVCHRCGWTFPKPHPSAKNRRAHKKNCGKIEGFKLIGVVEEKNAVAIVASDELREKSEEPGSEELKPEEERENTERTEIDGGRIDEESKVVHNLCNTDSASEANNSDADKTLEPYNQAHSNKIQGIDVKSVEDQLENGTQFGNNAMSCNTATEEEESNACTHLKGLLLDFPIEETCHTSVQNVVATSMVSDGVNAETNAVMDVPTVLPSDLATNTLNKDSKPLIIDDHTEIDVTSGISTAGGTVSKDLPVETPVEMGSSLQGEQMDAAGLYSRIELLPGTESCPVEINTGEHLDDSFDTAQIEYLTYTVDDCIMDDHKSLNEVMSGDHVVADAGGGAVPDAVGQASEATTLFNGSGHIFYDETEVITDDIVGCCRQVISNEDSCLSDTRADPEPTSHISESELPSDKNKEENELEMFEHLMVSAAHDHVSGSDKQPYEEPRINDSDEVNLSNHDAQIFRLEEHTTPLVDTQASALISDTLDNSKTGDISEVDPFGTCDQSLQEGAVRIVCGQQSDAANVAADGSGDSNSQTDSVEGRWGSVSGYTTDGPIALGTEAIPAIRNQTPSNPHASDLATEDGLAEHNTDDMELFEPPSFMTLVEPANLPARSSHEIQRTNIIRESQGKNKNEIIEKVVNWNSGKPHTPLKNLLAEANFMLKKERELQDGGPTTTTLGSEIASEHSSKSSIRTDHKEWNSPARLPVGKNKKRKVKGKSTWVPFICCSYVN